jgi:hypothetical protein
MNFNRVITNTQLQVLFMSDTISRINNMYTTQNDDTKNEQQNSKFSDTSNAQNRLSGNQTCTM